MKGGTGDALDTLANPSRRKRDVNHVRYPSAAWAAISSTARPKINRISASVSFSSSKTIDYERKKREMNEFSNDIEPVGESGSGSVMGKVKNFMNKVLDVFDEMVQKVQNLGRSVQTDGTVPTKSL